MKRYYIEDILSKDVYTSFVHYMLEYSDSFSLVYFKYKDSEKLKKKTKEVKKILRRYVMYSENVLSWPGTETLNYNNHIYRLVMYRAELNSDTKQAMSYADCLCDWDYPQLPIDLCFYKDGYACFALSSHERWNELYIDDKSVINEIKDLGITLIRDDDIDKSKVFYNDKSKVE